MISTTLASSIVTLACLLPVLCLAQIIFLIYSIVICGPLQLLVFLATSTTCSFFMIALTLCGLFLCELNLTSFSPCQIFSFVSTQFGRIIKVIQCDNVHEFDNASSRAFFTTHRVVLRMSCPYTSLQNGKAESTLHTINNMIRSLLFQASFPVCYYVYGLHTAIYLPCRSPWCHPSYEHLRVFSCACYSNLSTQAPHKLAPQSTRCDFLRYSADHKGYRYLDLSTNNIIVFRHVVFDETDFPFAVSSRLTNVLNFFLQDDSWSAAPMPTLLPVP
jgi:hypothetical protein